MALLPDQAWDGTPFGGAKIALVQDGLILTYLRDDKPDIRFPGLWDLPGGGREGGETPLACVARELFEEFGIRLDRDRLVGVRRYPPSKTTPLPVFFYWGYLAPGQLGQIRFGDEGQRWCMMVVDEFLARADAVKPLQQRVRDCLPDFEL